MNKKHSRPAAAIFAVALLLLVTGLAYQQFTAQRIEAAIEAAALEVAAIEEAAIEAAVEAAAIENAAIEVTSPDDAATVTPAPTKDQNQIAVRPTDVLRPEQVVDFEEKVEVEWPEVMQQDRPYRVRVELAYAEIGQISPRIEFEGSTAQFIEIATPVGATPNAPIAGAFGARYEATILASLTGPDSLEIRTDDTEAFILDTGETIIWDWHITPREAGRYVLEMNIKARWENPEIDDIRDQQLARVNLPTTVKQRWFAFGTPFSLTAIVSAIAGAILAALVTTDSLQAVWRRMLGRELAADEADEV